MRPPRVPDKEVDWEIWIARGTTTPCRYVITSPKVSGGPQYIIDIRDWKTGAEAASGDFTSIPTDLENSKPMIFLESTNYPTFFN